ncbi:hypothetical protein SISNIDRAFT_448453 [Sistotremastrum niveocremeum HHB9708]|uniref:DUF6593 domain-containing protein n=1 Tax=Sistotremastrum niveocremeum HHB9708 TaxID=1314777 RepID=A0A164ZZ68_9AGAM|nr:hypothetical protein SISNIDRAFT_448453 [Sistotremastrum niveocremeum HHB9708]
MSHADSPPTWSPSFELPAYDTLPDYGDDEDTLPLADQFNPSVSHASFSELPADSIFTLTFKYDDPSNTKLTTVDGYTLYSASTQIEGVKDTQVLATHITGRRDKVIASYLRGRDPDDMLVLGGMPPMKRSSWLVPGRGYSKSAGTFHHNGKRYTWMIKKEDHNTTLELFAGNNKIPMARFKDSRRDWSIPPPALVIQKARLELQSSALHMLDAVVISLLLAERLRRSKGLKSSRGHLSGRETTLRMERVVRAVYV